ALSVLENLRFWYAFLGNRDATPASAESALVAVGLDGLASLPAAYLSAGQRRRLAIARLIAAPRPVWLLDEPTAALDTTRQARLADLMRMHLFGGGLIVAATHGPLGLDEVKELRLDSSGAPQAHRAPSRLAGEGRGEGSRLGDASDPTAPSTPDPSPQGGG